MTHHEAEHAEHKEPRYGLVWVWLLVLTVVEVWAAQSGMPKVGTVIALCSLALAKAALVAIYFMHLKFEKYALMLIVLSPLLLSAILYIGLMPDSTTHTRWLPPAP